MHIQAPLQTALGLFPWGQSGRVVKLTTHLHVVQRLNVNGAVFLLSVCVFMAGTGNILTLSLHVFGNKEKVKFFFCRSQWLRGQRRRSAAVHLLRFGLESRRSMDVCLFTCYVVR
jgi:hypothetical protein